MRFRKNITTACMTMFAMCAISLAEIPSQIAYQGIITDNAGNPVPDADYFVVFKIYSDSVSTSSSDSLWAEKQSVTTKSGMFGTMLGSERSLNGLAFDRPYYLGVTRNNVELKPRIKLLSAPYARYAAVADSSRIAGMALSARSVSGSGIADTSIDSGKIKAGAVTTAKIRDSVVTSEKIKDGTIQTVDAAGTFKAPMAGVADSARRADTANYAKKVLAIGTGVSTDSIAVGVIKAKESIGLKLVAKNGKGIAVDSLGNLGIGTTAPATRLHVNGEFSMNGNGLDGSTLQRFVVYADTSQGLLLEAPQNGSGKNLPINLSWRGSGVPGLTIDSARKVGIGTQTPSEKLEVAGNLKLSGTMVQDTWAAPTLTNRWASYGQGFNPPGYYRDKEGIVHLRGLVDSGIGYTIFTLPEGYRPQFRGVYLGACSDIVGGAPSAFCRIDITHEGVVTTYSYNRWVSLDGITFRAAGF